MVIDSGRSGTTRRLLELDLSVRDGVGGVAERGNDVVRLERGELSDDLFGGHAVGQHAEQGRDGDPKPANAPIWRGSTVMRSMVQTLRERCACNRSEFSRVDGWEPLTSAGRSCWMRGIFLGWSPKNASQPALVLGCPAYF